MTLDDVRVNLPRVLFPSWYAYMFRRADEPYYASNWWIVDWAIRLWCRLRGHPAGIVFYNVGGLEPDYTCKGCGDQIC